MIAVPKFAVTAAVFAGCPMVTTRGPYTTCRLISLVSRASISDKPPKIVEPVRLAYASYEGTDTQPPADQVPSPLIIMHGLFGSKSNWNSLCKALQKRTEPARKIIAVDARNHGDSPHSTTHTYEHLAEDVRNFLVEQRIQRASLLGHSMGGRAMMMFALNYPDKVDKLIVADISPVSTSPNLRSMPNLFHAMLSVKLPNDMPMATARNNVDFQLARIVNERGLRSFLLTNLVHRDKSYRWRCNVSVLLDNFVQNIANFPDVMELKPFNGPVLFLAGASSDYIQKKDHSQITKIFPNARFEYIDGAGHWLHSEKPAEFLEATLKFLNTKLIAPNNI